MKRKYEFYPFHIWMQKGRKVRWNFMFNFSLRDECNNNSVGIFIFISICNLKVCIKPIGEYTC